MHRSDFKIIIYSEAADPKQDQKIAKLNDEILNLVRKRLKRSPYGFMWHVSDNNTAALDAFSDSVLKAKSA